MDLKLSQKSNKNVVHESNSTNTTPRTPQPQRAANRFDQDSEEVEFEGDEDNIGQSPNL